MKAAEISKRDNVPHFSIITSIKSDRTSIIPPLKIRGHVEYDLKKLNLPTVSIFRPGILKKRPNPRFHEHFLA